MKIAFISTEKLPVPPVSGGAVQLYIDGILPYLAEKHNITVFGISAPGLPERESKGNISHVRLPGRTEGLYRSNLMKTLDSSYDLVHVFNRPKNVLALAGLFPDMRFSLSLHNEMFNQEKLSNDEAYACLKKVEFINTVSAYIAKTVALRIPEAQSKLRVVYSGADTKKHVPVWLPEGLDNKQALKKKLNLTSENIVLYVGRLGIKKGVHVLLSAMKKVVSELPDTCLVVVGSKWYGSDEQDDYVKSLKNNAKSLEGHIHFTGFIPPSEIPEYFNLGDVFVCASQWNEPLARVHYEAMASGIPIVTTNRGGNAEVVEHGKNGLVIEDFKDPEAMADSILSILRNPGLAQEMGRTGRIFAEERYNWKRVAEEIFPKDLAGV